MLHIFLIRVLTLVLVSQHLHLTLLVLVQIVTLRFLHLTYHMISTLLNSLPRIISLSHQVNRPSTMPTHLLWRDQIPLQATHQLRHINLASLVALTKFLSTLNVT